MSLRCCIGEKGEIVAITHGNQIPLSLGNPTLCASSFYLLTIILPAVVSAVMEEGNDPTRVRRREKQIIIEYKKRQLLAGSIGLQKSIKGKK